MAVEKTFKTRVALLYKTYEEYQAIQSNTPLKGEVCIVEVPQSTGAVQQEPAVLIAVGDGEHAWAQIPFISAKAADVYDWAKKENLDWNDLTPAFKAKLEEYMAPALDEKVDKEMSGTNGTAYIFNESDGGGARFVHKDGTESFVGVNDGGENGLVAQIYADKLVDGKWQGAKLDVSTNGIYYTVGNQSISQRMVDDNLLVVKKDIKDLAGGMHFIGAGELLDGQTIEQAAEAIYVAHGKDYSDKKAGDIIILKTGENSREFVYDGEVWVELGDQGLYATKAELAAEEEARIEEDTTLQANIDAEEEARIQGDKDRELEILPVSAYGFDTNLRVNQQVNGSELVDKVIEATNVDHKQVVIKSGDYKYNVISIVDDQVQNIKGFAIETMDLNPTSLDAEPAIEKGIFLYIPALGKTCSFYGREYTKKEIDEVINFVDDELRKLKTKKLDVLPLVDDPDDPGYGWEYHIPYGFEFTPTAEAIALTIKTLTLDNKFTKMNFDSALPGATSTTAGLMTAADKVALDKAVDDIDGLATVARTGKVTDLVQDPTDVIILDCNY